jgi:spore germination cell wall hydrolase CwlJ-like protein
MMKHILTVLLLGVIALGFNLHAEDNNTEIVSQVRDMVNKEVDCLAKNIYYEAGGESYEGKLAVAQVTINRTNDARYPKTICGVVYQKTSYAGKVTCQFTWTCERSYPIRSKYNWEESVMIARRALTESILHDKIASSNALHYHAVYVDPKWSKGKIIMKIGNHIFYV